MYRTRGARGRLKLNRTLGQSPRHRLAKPRQPRKKTLLAFLFCAGVDFLKKERVFFFRGSALNASGSVAGRNADERMYLREGVLDGVIRARERLRRFGFDLVVYDGWRSIELQENLFWFYMRAFTAGKFNQKEQFERLDGFARIKAYFASLSPETQAVMREANRTYVSWPSRDPVAPSPHTTGGAVDVWLIKNGAEANLGVPFDWMEAAGAFYHLKFRRKRLAGNDKRVCWNRTRIILAMADTGFSCYGPEFWHFNYGNQMDALVKGGCASYSYIEP